MQKQKLQFPMMKGIFLWNSSESDTEEEIIDELAGIRHQGEFFHPRLRKIPTPCNGPAQKKRRWALL